MSAAKEAQFIADMTRVRGMDFVRLGMRVDINGDPGTIKGMNSSGNLDVLFADQIKYGKQPHNCHPTWETCYYGADGNIVADYRSPAKRTAAAQ